MRARVPCWTSFFSAIGLLLDNNRNDTLIPIGKQLEMRAHRHGRFTRADLANCPQTGLYRKRANTPRSRTHLASSRFRYNTRTNRDL